MMRVAVILLVGTLGLLGCDGERASEAQCRTIFDRLVELELEEMGFVDPLLSKRRQQELATRYQKQLAACVGRRIPSDALGCVEQAESSEGISHGCLR